MILAAFRSAGNHQTTQAIKKDPVILGQAPLLSGINSVICFQDE